MLPYIVVVKQYERLAVFWLGKFTGLKSPGLKILAWPLHRTRRIDLRESVINIPKQTSITSDNAPINIDFLVYMRVIDDDAQKSVLEVVDYSSAVIGIATTTLRAVIGEMPLDHVLSQRKSINESLRQKLDEVTERWGIKVTQVEIKEIKPPPEIQDAMNRQMAAERVRRAVVTEAEGTREAAVTVAEGEKQATILDAEGQRQASILRAEGFSAALKNIDGAAKDIDANTLSLQYFDTLKQLGATKSTKFILPMEFTSLLRPFLGSSSIRAPRPASRRDLLEIKNLIVEGYRRAD